VTLTIKDEDLLRSAEGKSKLLENRTRVCIYFSRFSASYSTELTFEDFFVDGNFEIKYYTFSDLTTFLENMRQHQQHRCLEIFNKISSQEILAPCRKFLLSDLIYRNAI
jgi:hypothetical protein